MNGKSFNSNPHTHVVTLDKEVTTEEGIWEIKGICTGFVNKIKRETEGRRTLEVKINNVGEKIFIYIHGATEFEKYQLQEKIQEKTTVCNYDGDNGEFYEGPFTSCPNTHVITLPENFITDEQFSDIECVCDEFADDIAEESDDERNPLVQITVANEKVVVNISDLTTQERYQLCRKIERMLGIVWPRIKEEEL